MNAQSSQPNTANIPDSLHYGPEDCTIVVGDGYQRDPMHTAVRRAQAILKLIGCQYDGNGGSKLSDEYMENAICAVSGELAFLDKLIAHGMECEDASISMNGRPSEQSRPDSANHGP